MSRRDNLDRCATCQMHATLCICDIVPQLHPHTRLALVIHHREARKPTNTGLLAARCLAGSSVITIGERDPAEGADIAGRASDAIAGDIAGRAAGDGDAIADDVATGSAGGDGVASRAGGRLAFAPDEDPLLLYPAEDARPIAAHRPAPGRRTVLIVPDGSWRQAHKMRRRVPGLAAVPCVTLPDDALAPTSYRLRAEPHAGGLATLEAIARALRVLEGEPAGAAIEHALLQVFRVMRDRTLWLRGRLGDAAVTGGLPQAALDANPRGSPARRR